MFQNIIAIVCGVVLLYKGGEWLCRGGVSLAEKFKIPRVIIGVTLVSFVTSAPELAVVLNANQSQLSTLALSNIIGSNISNVGLILGVLIVGMSISLKSEIQNLWMVMVTVSVIFAGLLLYNGNLVRVEGIILCGLAFVTIYYLVKHQTSVVGIESTQVVSIKNNYKIIGLVIVSGICLWLGSEVLVKAVNTISIDLGISQRIMGLSVVAISTSLPELAASLVALSKKEAGISIGNIFGSNIFNLLVVMGLASTISEFAIPNEDRIDFLRDVIFMVGLSLMLYPLLFWVGKKLTLGCLEGSILLIFYFGYFYFILK